MALVALLFARPALPQDAAATDTAEEPALPRYHVEFIVFAHADFDLREESFQQAIPINHSPEQTSELHHSSIVHSFRMYAPFLEPTNPLAPVSPHDRIPIILNTLPGDKPIESLRSDLTLLDTRNSVEPYNEQAIEPELGSIPAAFDDQLEELSIADFANLRLDAASATLQEDALQQEIPYQAAGDPTPRLFRFRLLHDDELQLGDAYIDLDEVEAYEPLVHGGWVQEGLAPEHAHPFDLSYFGVTNPIGTIQLHLLRFLHVTVDLNFQLIDRQQLIADQDAEQKTEQDGERFDEQFDVQLGERIGTQNIETATPRPAESIFDEFYFEQRELAEIDLRPRYAINTNRRARSGELHYIDHPAFGVIVLVTPEPEKAEEGQDNTEDQTPAA